MKKLALIVVAMLTMVFTGCKTETSQVTVYVEDTLGIPVSGRYVFYADEASIVLDGLFPSPEELITDTEDCWEVAKTNEAGIVQINISLSVSKLKYHFMVYDAGTNKWLEKIVELRRGINDEISFTVNR